MALKCLNTFKQCMFLEFLRHQEYPDCNHTVAVFWGIQNFAVAENMTLVETLVP